MNWIAYCESPQTLIFVPNQPDEDAVRVVLGTIHGSDGDEFSIKAIPDNVWLEAAAKTYVDLSEIL